jgi:hypothetical protein
MGDGFQAVNKDSKGMLREKPTEGLANKVHRSWGDKSEGIRHDRDFSGKRTEQFAIGLHENLDTGLSRTAIGRGLRSRQVLADSFSGVR